MAAVTAAVTSMPGVLVPALAARMELMLIAGVVVAVPDNSVLTAETELMILPASVRAPASGSISLTRNPESWRQTDRETTQEQAHLG
jgi:hypothetical protein